MAYPCRIGHFHNAHKIDSRNYTFYLQFIPGITRNFVRGLKLDWAIYEIANDPTTTRPFSITDAT